MNEEELKNMLKGFMWGMLLCGLLGLLSGVLSGCSSQRGVMGGTVTVRTDTVYKMRVAMDTVCVRDSVYVTERTMGDTVYRDRTTWRWRERVTVRTDTIYKAAVQRDTVRVPVPTGRKATWWERNVREPMRDLTVTAVVLTVIVMVAAWWLRRQRKRDE